MNFNAFAIKKSNDVHNEMIRLNANLCHDNHVTIPLLNERSIAAKLPDIANDNGLKCANIMYFCETWLTPSEPSSVLQNSQITIRCDRPSGDNKGGVMIGVPGSMQPTSTSRYASSGIDSQYYSAVAK